MKTGKYDNTWYLIFYHKNLSTTQLSSIFYDASAIILNFLSHLSILIFNTIV